MNLPFDLFPANQDRKKNPLNSMLSVRERKKSEMHKKSRVRIKTKSKSSNYTETELMMMGDGGDVLNKWNYD